jgi:uncharacterized protein (DUF2249 family)/quercetin dioxygenase-like cupin family protein
LDGNAVAGPEVDVRPLRKPEKHPTIFAAYDRLPPGSNFVLVNDHDPKHLRDEFEADHPGSFDWEYMSREPRNWRIRITKLASAPLPRVLTSTATLAAETGEPDVSGAVWKLQIRDRHLDANVIALPPGAVIARHAGPDLDVFLHVIAGSGELAGELGTVGLEPGALVWLPRRSQRQFTAGPGGLRYLTVHQRRQALVLQAQWGTRGSNPEPKD